MRVLKDISLYVSSTIIKSAIPFLLIPYFSRKLGVAGYGELAYYQTFLMLFGLLIGLSQQGAIQRYYYRYGERSLPLVIRASYLYTFFVGSIFLIVCLILKSTILACISIIVVFQTLCEVKLTIAQTKKQAVKYAISSICTSIIMALCAVALMEIFTTNLVFIRFVAMLVGSVLSFIFIFYYFKDQVTGKKIFKWEQLYKAVTYLLIFGIPLIFHHLSGFLKGQLDRVIIYHQYSETDLGLYAMGANLASVVTVLLMAVNKAIVPYYFDKVKNKTLTLKKINVLSIGLAILVIPMYFCVKVIPESWMLFFIGNKFIGVKHFFNLFLVGATLFLPYMVLANYLFYKGKTKILSIISILSTLLYLLVLFILLPYGIDRLPYATIAGQFATIIILNILFYFEGSKSENCR